MRKPIYLFGGFGLLALMLSFGVGVWALALKYFATTSLIQTPLPLLSIFFAVTGILSIPMGMLAEMLNRTYHESRAKPVYRIGRIVRRGESG